jgi:hypothetical protein
MMKVTTDQVGAQRIDIFVDNSGEFHAEYNEQSYRAETRMLLIKQLEKAVKSAENEKAIPVTIIDMVVSADKRDEGKYESGRGVIQAKLRGKHGREWSTWLFMTDDGKKKFKLSSHETRKLCRRLTPEEIAEYERLAARVDEAEMLMAEWLATVHVSPEEALKLE